MSDAETSHLLQIFPSTGEQVSLQGLYLTEPFAPPTERVRPFVYTNFIASLDGRISLPDPATNKFVVPPAIANARDWRLFQELAAAADAVVTSAAYVRDLPNDVTDRSFPVSSKPEHKDLLDWRRARGLPPQPAVVIVTASLELPPLRTLVKSGRAVYVATGATAPSRKIENLRAQGVRVLRAGAGARVEGGRLIEALAGEAHTNIAMIGGGQVLNALVADDVLDRLYLTLTCQMLGGLSFDTMLTGAALERPARFTLNALHYDAVVEQLFAVFERAALKNAG